MQNINNISKKLEEYINVCLSNTDEQYQHLSGAGAIHFLEEKLQAYYNKKYAVTFSNATIAIQTLCIALELNNTEILTSPINWGGSIAPLLFHRNNLRFIAIDPVSLNLSLDDLPSAITKKTKAILSVDFNGLPVDSYMIKNFCSQNGLLYISDSAQSLGSFLNNKPAGYSADAIVLSFSPGKSFFAGEGGAVITDHYTIYKKLMWYSQHPSRQKTLFGLSNYNEYAPINGRMNPFSAILLYEKFEDYVIALKEYQAKCFQLLKKLQANNLIEDTPHFPNPSASTFFGFPLKLKESYSINHVKEFLKEQKKPFIANEYFPKLIPFDMSFRNQFRNKFSCSKSLLEQSKTMQPNYWFKLTYIPSISTEC
jgi:dTDP-4-amino-4,6-dideoxygalactose transaminase